MDDRIIDDGCRDDGVRDDRTVLIEDTFDADPATLWHALTEPEAMSEWLDQPVDFTLEPGAEGTIGGDDSRGATVLVVEEVDHQRRLVFRWASPAEAPTVVELDLRPAGRRTHLTIVERPLRPGQPVAPTTRACALALAA